MLIHDIKNRLDNARKEKAPEAAMLSLLYSNCVMLTKNGGKGNQLTNDKVIAVVKRLQKGIIETKNMAVNRPDVAEKCDRELKVLEEFLPRQLTVEELEKVVARLISTLENPTSKDMGKVMSKLREEYVGLYDGKVAIGVVKKALSGEN